MGPAEPGDMTVCGLSPTSVPFPSSTQQPGGGQFSGHSAGVPSADAVIEE